MFEKLDLNYISNICLNVISFNKICANFTATTIGLYLFNFSDSLLYPLEILANTYRHYSSSALIFERT